MKNIIFDSSRRFFLRVLGSVAATAGVVSCSGGSGNENQSENASAPNDTGIPADTSIPLPPRNANLLSALRDFGPDRQTFWCCDLNNFGGTAGVLIDGKDHFTGETLSAENDYTGLVTATGLSKGAHTYRLTLNGRPGVSEYTFRTGPEPGEDFDILYVGDANLKANEAFRSLVLKEPQAAFVFTTEIYYLDVASQYGGRLYTDATQLAPTADHQDSYFKFLNGDGTSRGFRQKYRHAMLYEPYRHFAMNVWPMMNMPHNHDMAASDPPGRSGTVRYDAAHKALFEYPSNGNPRTDDADVDSEPDPALYFNKKVGDVEIIAPDMLSYSAPFAAGEMLGSNGNGAGNDRQTAWLKRRIEESQARFILLFLQAPVRGPEWYDPASGVLQTISRSPKTIVTVTADLHNAYAQLIRQYMWNPMLEIGASSFSAVTSSAGFYIPATNLVYFSNAHNKASLKSDYISGTTLLLNSTQGMRPKRKLAVSLNNKFTQTVEIKSIDGDDTVTVYQELTGPANAGNTVVYYDWSDSSDVENSPETTHCCYAKVLVRPSGTQARPYSHIELQIKRTFADKTIWSAVVREGERIPVEVTYVG